MTAPTATGAATAAMQARWSDVMLGNYGVPPVALARGEGAWVWDVDGTRYLDLLGGIAVSSLGHAHPAVVEAVTRQVATLVHTSNLAMHEPGIALAERLAALVPAAARVFLCQDGATANEAALKIARKRGNQQGRDEILSTHGGFHGRTAGALAVTGTAGQAHTVRAPARRGRVRRLRRRRRPAGCGRPAHRGRRSSSPCRARAASSSRLRATSRPSGRCATRWAPS